MNKHDTITKVIDALPKVDGLKPALLYPVFGAMVGVRYPYRKSPDVYLMMEGEPIHCCQCKDNEPFPAEQWLDHIRMHDRAQRPRALVTLTKDGSLVVIGEFASEENDDGSGRWETLCGAWGRCEPVKEKGRGT